MRGFDERLRLWINAPDVMLPDKRDKEAAVDALNRLKGWLSEFPFVSPLDLSAGARRGADGGAAGKSKGCARFPCQQAEQWGRRFGTVRILAHRPDR